MTVDALNRFLPEKEAVIYAFDKVNAKYPDIKEDIKAINSMSVSLLPGVIFDYLNTGIAYFANRGYDTQLQEAGTATWHSISEAPPDIEISFTLIEGLLSQGIPVSPTLTDDRPLFVSKEVEGNPNPETILFVPTNIILQARTMPLEGLASILHIASYFRDLSEGHVMTEEGRSLLERSGMLQGRFLSEALKRHPSALVSRISLGIVEDYKRKVGGQGFSLN